MANLTQKLAQALTLTAVLAAPEIALADEQKQYEQKPQLTDRQKEELEAHKYKLRDGWWSNGSISNLDPANASVDDSSDYYKAFLDIRDFLSAYDRETLPEEYKQWHDKCIDALLRNIFVPNRTVASAGGFGRKGLNDEIRETLKKEGVLDYTKQLDDLVNEGQNALKHAGQIATLSKPEEYEQTKAKVEALRDYVTVLQQLADATIVRALEERLRPVIHSPGEIDDARIEISRTAREAYDHLSELQEAIDTKDVTRVKTELNEWRSKLKKVLNDSQELAKKAGEQTVFELEKPYEWRLLVVRKNHQTSDEMWATKAFAEEWGKNGEHFYGKVDRLRELEEGFVSLEKYMEERKPRAVPAKTPKTEKPSVGSHPYLPPGLEELTLRYEDIKMQLKKMAPSGREGFHEFSKNEFMVVPDERFSETMASYLGLPGDRLYYFVREIHPPTSASEIHVFQNNTQVNIVIEVAYTPVDANEQASFFQAVVDKATQRLGRGPNKIGKEDVSWSLDDQEIEIRNSNPGRGCTWLKYTLSKRRTQ